MDKEQQQIIEKIKRDTLAYLASQGYKVTWEQVMLRFAIFADGPVGEFENEIDSILAGPYDKHGRLIEREATRVLQSIK